MTFEDFLHESQVGYSTIETKDDLEDVIKRTWNAAINAARWNISPAFKWDDREELQDEVDTLIKDLLTNK